MRISRFSHYALGICAAAAFLAGCGGPQPPTGSPGVMPQIAALQSQSALRDRSGSWMLPEAKSEDLLYISDVTGVHVFSYPKGTLVGDLTGFASPQGLWTADRRRGRGAVD